MPEEDFSAVHSPGLSMSSEISHSSPQSFTLTGLSLADSSSPVTANRSRPRAEHRNTDSRGDDLRLQDALTAKKSGSECVTQTCFSFAPFKIKILSEWRGGFKTLTLKSTERNRVNTDPQQQRDTRSLGTKKLTSITSERFILIKPFSSALFFPISDTTVPLNTYLFTLQRVCIIFK